MTEKLFTGTLNKNKKKIKKITFSQMIAQQFRQLNVYCRHLYFMKTGHEINCCVLKSRECSTFFFFPVNNVVKMLQLFSKEKIRHSKKSSFVK